MGSGPILRTLVLLGLPAVTTGITQTLFEVVDTWFVTQLGPDHITGVGLIGPIMFTAFAVSQTVNVGVAAMLSRRLGQKRPDLARDVLNHGLLLATVIGLGLSVFLILCRGLVLDWLGASGAIRSYADQYSSIIFVAIVFMHIGAASDAALRAQGNTVTTMKVGVTANIANIILDRILIFDLGMGVVGAAWATLVCRGAMAVVLLGCLWMKNTELNPGRIEGQRLFVRWGVVGQIAWIGLPASVGIGAMSGSILFINQLLMSLEAHAVGMLMIAWRIESLAFTPVFGLFSAVVPMVGYNLGAHQYHRCARTIWTAAGLSAGVMTTIGAVIWLFPAFFFGLFTSEPKMLSMGIEYLKIMMLVYPIIGIDIMMSAGYQGLGKSWISMLSQIWRNIILKLPFAYWFAAIWGLSGVWWSFPVSTVFSSGIFITIMVLVLRNLQRGETGQTTREATG